MSGGGGSDGGYSTGGSDYTNLGQGIPNSPPIPTSYTPSTGASLSFSAPTDQGEGVLGSTSPTDFSFASDSSGGSGSNLAGTDISSLAAPASAPAPPPPPPAIATAGGVQGVGPTSTPALDVNTLKANAPGLQIAGGAPGGAAAAGGGIGGGVLNIPGQASTPIDLTELAAGDTSGLSTGAQGTPQQPAAAPKAPTAAASNTGGFNPLSLLGPAVNAGGLIYAAQQQKQQTAGLPSAGQSGAQISQAATSLGQQAATTNANAQPILSQGQVLTDYLNNGQLPSTIQAQLDQQIKSQKAQIISGYASRGQNTDPTQNSTLAQELAGVDNNAQVTKGQLETQLFSAGQQMVQTANTMFAQGASDTQVQAQLLNMSASIDQSLTAQTQKAIANFASSLGTAAGGTKAPTIQLGGTSVQQA